MSERPSTLRWPAAVAAIAVCALGGNQLGQYFGNLLKKSDTTISSNPNAKHELEVSKIVLVKRPYACSATEFAQADGTVPLDFELFGKSIDGVGADVKIEGAVAGIGGCIVDGKDGTRAVEITDGDAITPDGFETKIVRVRASSLALKPEWLEGVKDTRFSADLDAGLKVIDGAAHAAQGMGELACNVALSAAGAYTAIINSATGKMATCQEKVNQVILDLDNFKAGQENVARFLALSRIAEEYGIQVMQESWNGIVATYKDQARNQYPDNSEAAAAAVKVVLVDDKGNVIPEALYPEQFKKGAQRNVIKKLLEGAEGYESIFIPDKKVSGLIIKQTADPKIDGEGKK